MTETKTETRKEQIVNAAFTVWGETHFTDTSLARVSSYLGVTKQALYRHIAGKEELLTEMERQFAGDLHAIIDEFEAKAAGVSFSAAVSRYVELLFDFFSAHPYYYLYLSLHLAQLPANQGPAFHRVRERHQTVLANVLRRSRAVDPGRISMAAHFLSMTGFLWMASCFWTEDGHRREAVVGRAELAERRELAVRIVLGGLFPDTPRRLPFGEIEANASVAPEELPERNRILTAIAEVVTEQGFEQATVERIAERAGMSKSSLYFYFRNRAEMMASMLVPEHERLMDLVEARAARFADFGSQLYAFMVVTASYAAQSRAILTALDWMRFHRIRVQIGRVPKRRPIHGFLAERLAREDFADPRLEELEVVAYLHHLIMRPVLERGAGEGPAADPDLQQLFRRIRLLYPMVVGGLANMKENEK
ncbi:MAG: TetR/AcrR family transcriptional regulator [Spirochaetaceae bacterium]